MTVVVTHTTPADSSFSTAGASAWNANHTLSGVGTMAGQDSNAVAITGGSVDGTTVGATTASTGAFTTLSASSTVSGTGFSTYLASPPAIGGTTPAAGTFTTLIGGSGSANYEQITGGATGKAVQFQSLGTDAAVSLAIQPKGTGAIDLAAGSSGVNISNGGTVTALTVTAAGTSYTTIPTPAITAPTTAGGVQAVSTATMSAATRSIVNGGTGYTLNDTITVSGGTFTTAASFTVSAVSGGVVTTLIAANGGTYSVLPTGTLSTTGGTGTGLTITIDTWSVRGLTIGTAGSGYVEQPTVTFSGGGGSGAAAYATVGSDTTIKSIGANLLLNSVSGTQIQASDVAGASTVAWWGFTGTNASTGTMITRVAGGGTNTTLSFIAKGTGAIQFATANTGTNVQMQVSNTASAVNYVQVTGGTTGSGPVISGQGSDTTVSLLFQAKGASGTISFGNIAGTGNQAFRISTAAAVNTGNLILVTGAAAGASPSIAAISGTSGTDADIDLTLTPKGAGRVNITTSIKPKVNSTTSVASPLAWNSTSYDEYALTALANALTISADANTAPADGQRMMFRFKDNGTAQTLTWTTGSARAFRVVGVTLPTTTVASKLLYVGCIYNAADSRWDAIAVGQEA
jgi:hypothetical protein